LTTKTTPLQAIKLKCIDCIHDPYSGGTALEQVAYCESACCALHHLRPVPRKCKKNGEIIPEEIAKIREKIDQRNRELNER
jgi:hypothetical protein